MFKCSKCGQDDRNKMRIQYQGPGVIPEQTMGNGVEIAPAQEVEECLGVSCECGYQWTQVPLDVRDKRSNYHTCR